MNTFTLEIFDDEGSECTFYTVKNMDDDLSQTDKFWNKYANPNHPYYEEANMLFRLVFHNIGNKFGARDEFFDRVKNRIQALPPKPKRHIPEIAELGIHFPLRLYCFRLSENLVILFNGGVKDNRTDQESPDISMKFIEAQQYALKIQKAIEEGRIIIDENRTLKTFDDNSEIIIY